MSSDVTSTTLGPRACTAATAALASARLRIGRPGEIFELELVGRDDVGRRHGLVAHELGDARPHEDAAADVADHRVAAIDRRRVGGPHPVDRARGSRCRCRPSPCSPTARRRSGRARRARRCPPPVRRPSCRRRRGPSRRRSRCGWRTARCGSAQTSQPEPLHREHRRGVADMAVGDVGLDRQDVHSGRPVRGGGSAR